MADNVQITAGSGTTIRTDDVGGVQYPVTKIDLGGDGATSPLVRGQQNKANSIPVVQASDSAETWVPGAWTAGFAAADLNSLANNGCAISSLSAPQIDTDSSLERYVQFEFDAGSISPGANAHVIAILLPRLSDGATYADGEAGTTAANQPLWLNNPSAIIPLRTKASSTQQQQSEIVPLPPGKYKVALINKSGVTLAASGNQLSYRLLKTKHA